MDEQESATFSAAHGSQTLSQTQVPSVQSPRPKQSNTDTSDATAAMLALLHEVSAQQKLLMQAMKTNGPVLQPALPKTDARRPSHAPLSNSERRWSAQRRASELAKEGSSSRRLSDPACALDEGVNIRRKHSAAHLTSSLRPERRVAEEGSSSSSSSSRTADAATDAAARRLAAAMVGHPGQPAQDRRSVVMKYQDWRAQHLEQSVDSAVAPRAEQTEPVQAWECDDTDEGAEGETGKEGQRRDVVRHAATAPCLRTSQPDPAAVGIDDVSRGSRWRMKELLAAAGTRGAVFLPGTSGLAAWRLVVLLTSLVYAVYVPMAAAFPELGSTATSTRMVVLEPLLEAVLVADIGVHFLTAASWRGLVVRDLRFVATSYLTGWFAIDLAAALPLGFAANKLARLAALTVAFRTRFDSFNPGMVLLVKLLALVVLAWHWAACMFWAIAHADAAGIADVAASQAEEQWTPRLHETLVSEDFALAYSHSFFFAVVVTTGVGWDIIPLNTTQVFFTSAMIILGLIFFALLVGSASGAVAAFNATLSGRRAKLEVVNQYLRFHRVPVQLQRRVRAFLSYSWAAGGTQTSELETVEELEGLPDQLRAELSLSVNRDLIENVPMFKDLSTMAKHAVISTVKRRVYLPGEVVVTQGDTASEVRREPSRHPCILARAPSAGSPLTPPLPCCLLGRALPPQFFVLYRGSLSIEVGGRIQTMLTDGAFFGEVALLALLDGQQDAKRTATCTAVTYSDVCCITRDDFEHISREFPELLQALKTQGTNLSIKQKKQDRSIPVAASRRKLVRKGSVLNMVVVPSAQAVRSGAEETEALNSAQGAPNSARGATAKAAFARFHKEGSGKIRRIVPSRESMRASAEAAQTRKHSC